MSEGTKIQWADDTANFWRGCTKVSAGCANCYAEVNIGVKMAGIQWGKGAPRVRSKSAVADCLRWNKKPWICNDCGRAYPATITDGTFELCAHCLDEKGQSNLHRRRVFSLSLGDWLDDEVPIEWLAEMLDTIRRCDQVTWILCSKRWENFEERLFKTMLYAEDQTTDTNPYRDGTFCHWLEQWKQGWKIPANIIGLCSVENQEAADSRIPQFLTVPLACRGLSLEPLLGPVKLSGDWLLANLTPESANAIIDWLIIGGESGPNARLCNVEWIRSLVAQGKAAGVATFVKQLGADPRGLILDDKFPQGEPLKFKDKKGGNPAEWPADLRVQEFPSLANGGTP